MPRAIDRSNESLSEGDFMQNRKIFSMAFASAVSAAGILAIAVPAFCADAPDHAAMDHSTMDHSTMNMGRDDQGRTLHGMKHQMDPAITKELRERVSLYKDYTDAQIALSMDMMGSEYAWYISPPDMKGSEGVLILMHGFGDQGDKIFKDRVALHRQYIPHVDGHRHGDDDVRAHPDSAR